jgi:hypothetical protein
MLPKRWPTLRTIGLHLAIIGLLMPVWYWLGREIVSAFYQHRLTLLNEILNTGAWQPTDGQGYNPSNVYWVVPYDCRTTDVEVSGTLPPARYWSATAYDRYMMPLPSYVADSTLKADSQKHYTLRITTQPRGGTNEIDVRHSPTGIVVMRISNPEDETARTAPTVRPVPRN